MNNLQSLLILLGVPVVICAIAGAIHGRKSSATSRGLWIGAWVVSAITCWSALLGGAGDMPLPALLPSWIAAPLGPFLGFKTTVLPPWWLSPWLPFLLYRGAAALTRRALPASEART